MDGIASFMQDNKNKILQERYRTSNWGVPHRQPPGGPRNIEEESMAIED